MEVYIAKNQISCLSYIYRAKILVEVCCAGDRHCKSHHACKCAVGSR